MAESGSRLPQSKDFDGHVTKFAFIFGRVPKESGLGVVHSHRKITDKRFILPVFGFVIDCLG